MANVDVQAKGCCPINDQEQDHHDNTLHFDIFELFTHFHFLHFFVQVHFRILICFVRVLAFFEVSGIGGVDEVFIRVVKHFFHVVRVLSLVVLLPFTFLQFLVFFS